MVQYASGSFAPFPITLTLSLPPSRRAKAPLRRGGGREMDSAHRAAKPKDLGCTQWRGGFTLSPRERAGLRGKRPLHRAAHVLHLTSGPMSSGLFGLEPFTISGPGYSGDL